MTIQATNTTPNAAAAAGAVPVNPKSEMGKDTFLKLLVAELKNQDPQDPMQAREMVAQLAQLSSVEKLSAIDTKLADLEAGNTATATLQSAALIGRSVTADTRRLTLTNTANPTGTYNLELASDEGRVMVRDAAGNVVRTIALGAQRAGQHTFLWDGKSDDGMRVPSADYTFDVAAKSGGIPVPATTAITGVVNEVTYENGVPQVVVAGAHIPVGDVTSIVQ